MALTRRKFLKHLAFITTTVALGPAAIANVADAAADPKLVGTFLKPEWVWIDVVEPLKAQPIEGDSALEGQEERLEYKKVRVNPLFKGKIGIYDGFTLHEHR
jgi:hypothetical protein